MRGRVIFDQMRETVSSHDWVEEVPVDLQRLVDVLTDGWWSEGGFLRQPVTSGLVPLLDFPVTAHLTLVARWVSVQICKVVTISHDVFSPKISLSVTTLGDSPDNTVIIQYSPDH